MIFVVAATEVETLKKALVEAKKKAAKEQAAREKHEARVGEVQQELAPGRRQEMRVLGARRCGSRDRTRQGSPERTRGPG